jgi:hypothetical protein
MTPVQAVNNVELSDGFGPSLKKAICYIAEEFVTSCN